MTQNQNKYAFTVQRYGKLVDEHRMRDQPAVHALMEYALTIGKLVEDNNTTVTGQPKREIKYKLIMRTMAQVHGTPPEEMIQHWDEVDRVLLRLGLKPLPAEYKMSGKLLNTKGKRMLTQ